VPSLGPEPSIFESDVENVKMRTYKTIILLMVLYGCETLSWTLRVFEKRVLRRIFGPKRDKVTGEWRRLHKDELRDLYSSPSIIRILSRGGLDGRVFSTNGGEEERVRLLVGKPGRKRPLGRPRLKWLDKIRMDVEEMEWGDVDWIGFSQNRNRWRALVNLVLNVWVP
jgi:hypothetical protein